MTISRVVGQFLVYSFSQYFLRHLLCSRHCARLCEHNGEPKQAWPLSLQSLESVWVTAVITWYRCRVGKGDLTQVRRGAKAPLSWNLQAESELVSARGGKVSQAEGTAWVKSPVQEEGEAWGPEKGSVRLGLSSCSRRWERGSGHSTQHCRPHAGRSSLPENVAKGSGHPALCKWAVQNPVKAKMQESC